VKRDVGLSLTSAARMNLSKSGSAPSRRQAIRLQTSPNAGPCPNSVPSPTTETTAPTRSADRRAPPVQALPFPSVLQIGSLSTHIDATDLSGPLLPALRATRWERPALQMHAVRSKCRCAINSCETEIAATRNRGITPRLLDGVLCWCGSARVRGQVKVPICGQL
jgi:hypothetical protein